MKSRRRISPIRAARAGRRFTWFFFFEIFLRKYLYLDWIFRAFRQTQKQSVNIHLANNLENIYMNFLIASSIAKAFTVYLHKVLLIITSLTKAGGRSAQSALHARSNTTNILTVMLTLVKRIGPTTKSWQDNLPIRTVMLVLLKNCRPASQSWQFNFTNDFRIFGIFLHIIDSGAPQLPSPL